MKNFITTLRRFKLASTLNIVGLAIAFAAFAIILMQVSYEYGFDKFHKKAGRIYYGIIVTSEGANMAVPRPFINALGRSSAAIESYALVTHSWIAEYLSVERDGRKVDFLEEITDVDSTFGSIFDLRMVQGSANVINDPTKVLLPRSLAEKFFETADAAGRTIQLAGEQSPLTVGGVFEDFPNNSQLRNTIYRKIADGKDDNAWNRYNYSGYFVLAPSADPRDVEREFMQTFDMKTELEDPLARVELVPIEELYFDARGIAPKRGNRATTDILLAIAMLVVAVAAINFINFTTSLTPLRIKGLNIRKILGSRDMELRAMLVGEAVGIAVMAYVVSIFIVQLAAGSGIQQYFVNSIDVSSNISTMLWVGLLAVGVGVLSGIYPAFYSTRFAPVMVLSGSFAMSRSGRALRTALIGFQFVVSIGLIIGALFLQLQNSYMRGMDTGMARDNIAMFKIGGDLMGVKNEAFNSLLRQNPQIEDVAYCQMNIGVSDQSQNWGVGFKDQEIQFAAYPCSWNFPQMMGMKLTYGEFFSEGDSRGLVNNYIFNQTASMRYNITTDDGISDINDTLQSRIRGVVQDFNFHSLASAIAPMAFVIMGKAFAPEGSELPEGYVKFRGPAESVVEHIKRSAAAIAPDYPLSVRFYDEAFDELYNRDLKITSLITLCSLLAVVIALIGVFGLVTFETQYRRREIGLRKVYGSTVTQILAMFNRRFVWIVVVCFAIAAPAAYYGVSMWLEGFAYRTPIYWWVFAAALFVVLFVTLLTVNIQSYKAATENPINSIKS